MVNIRLWVVIVFIMCWTTTAIARDIQETELETLSAWTNQSGSTLYIENIDPSGQISGIYINRASGWGCQNTPYPVTGWIHGTAITFTVNWVNSTESCNSITSWTGFNYQGNITTLWQLVINGSTSTSQIVKGEDIFKRTQQKKLKSLITK